MDCLLCSKIERLLSRQLKREVVHLNGSSLGDPTYAENSLFLWQFWKSSLRLDETILVRMETASWTMMSLSRWCCSIETIAIPFLTGISISDLRISQYWFWWIPYFWFPEYQGWDLGWSQVNIFLFLLHLFNKVSLQCLLMSLYRGTYP